MTVARAYRTTQNGKEVRYIVADVDCVTVVNIPGSVIDSGMFGINGTFFNSSTKTLLGVAVNNNGSGATAVRTGGDRSSPNLCVKSLS